jgi:cell division protein FtsQ
MIDAGRSIPRLLGGRRRARRRSDRSRRIPIRAPRIGPKLLLAVVAAGLLLGGGWLWFRDSSFVAVKRVTVTGLTGPDSGQIRHALTTAALNMTTLDVSMGQLQTAVAPYPVVKNLKVSTRFPHGMLIRVIEQIPVGEVTVDGRTIAVAGDGTLLHGAAGTSSLPEIPVRVPPGGTRLAGSALDAVAVLAAAPYQMLARVSQVTDSTRHGPEAQLRNGPAIYFGDSQRLAAKWIAAIAVVGNPTSAGAAYIDVSDPERPAAGGGTANQSSGSGASGTPAAGASSTAATGVTATGAAAPGATPATSGAAATGATPSTSGTAGG